MFYMFYLRNGKRCVLKGNNIKKKISMATTKDMINIFKL